MSRHLRALMCLLGFLAAGTGTVAGAGECGPYQVTFYEFGSLYYKDEAGNFVGIDKDVIDELGRRTGCRFQGVLDSRVRTWAHMADGTLDMTVSGVATPEREAFAEFIPYSNSRNFLIVRPELAEKVLSLRAFTADKRLRLAVVKSFKHGNTLDVWIDALRAQGRVDEYGDAEVVARIFAGGRADAGAPRRSRRRGGAARAPAGGGGADDRRARHGVRRAAGLAGRRRGARGGDAARDPPWPGRVVPQPGGRVA